MIWHVEKGDVLGWTPSIALFIDSFFVCQTYAVILLELHLFETRKESLVVALFAAEFIVFFVVCLSLLCCSCFEEPIHTKIIMVVRYVFKRNLTGLTQLFNGFSPFFLSCTPNIY